MSPVESNGHNRHGLPISLLILVAGFCLYFFSIDGHAPSFTRNNFVLDSDIKPVARVIAGGQLRNVSRHPLYGIFLGVPGSALDSLLDDPISTGRFSSAAAGAVASLIAFWFFAGLLGSRVEAGWFCLLASCSASVWLFGAIPETHIYNYAAVVTGFVLLRAMSRASSAVFPSRFLWLAISTGVFLMGITLTNIVYVALGFGLGLSTIPMSFFRRVGRFAVFGGGVLLLFAAFSAVSLYLEPDETNLLKKPSAPFTNPFIRWSRLPELDSFGSNVRMFLLGNVIASPPTIELVPTLDGIQQMIQLGRIGRSETLILVYLAVTCTVLASNRSKGGFGLVGRFAGLVILFNLALHQVFFGNGQPFMFSIHTVFPLVVLLALLYRNSRVPTKRLLIGGLVCAIVFNNAIFMMSMNELISRECLEQTHTPKICTSWSLTVPP